MNRIGLCTIIVAVIGGLVVEPASAQVPVYMPSPSSVPPVSAPTIADPSPVYPPAVPNLSLAQPYSGAASAESPMVPQTPIYRPAAPAFSPAGAPPAYSPLPGYPGMNGGVAPNPAPNAAQYKVPTNPAYDAPPYGQDPSPSDGAMPYGSFDRQNFSSGAHVPPPPKSRWLPSYGIPTPPGYGAEGIGGACGTGACGAGACGTSGACAPGGCDPCANPCGCGRWYDNLSVFAGFDAFKNPVDLDGFNGNFGTRVGFNAALPVWAPWGLGVQASGSAGWYDWKGSQFTGEDYRFQNFWTFGVFQRSCATGLGFGVAYDWLNDDYFTDFRFGQWRAGVSWQFNACNEIGFWAALPDRRDSTTVTGTLNQFSPLMQGNLYWRHVWSCAASTTLYGGLAESPSDATMGVSSQVALNKYLALYANAAYVLPSTGDLQGHQDEIWNVSVGLMIYPGSAMRVAQSQFRPFFTPADNGNFGVWRK